MDDGKQDDCHRVFGHEARADSRKAIGGSDQPSGRFAPVFHHPEGNAGAESAGDHGCRQDEDPQYKENRFVTKITISLGGIHDSRSGTAAIASRLVIDRGMRLVDQRLTQRKKRQRTL